MVALSPPVEEAIEQLTRRVRLVSFMRLGCLAIAAAAAVNCLLLLIDRLIILPFDPLVSSVPIFVIGLVVAGLLAAAPRIDSLWAVRLAEQRLGLKERISTSILLGDNAERVEPAFVRLQRRDAEALAATITPNRVAPIDVRREGFYAIVGLIAFFVLALLNVIFPPFSDTVRYEHSYLVAAADNIDKAARKLDHAAAPGSQSKAVAAELATLAQKLRAPGTTKQQAQAAIQQASDDIARRQAEMAAPAQTASPNDQQVEQMAAQNTTTSGAGQSSSSIMSEGARDYVKTQDPYSIAVMLRKLADHLDQYPESSGDQSKTANNLRGFESTLRGDGNSEAADHVARAEQALARGDQHGAATELRQAADAIQRRQQDGQGMQDAQRSLANAERQVQSAQAPPIHSPMPLGFPGGMSQGGQSDAQQGSQAGSQAGQQGQAGQSGQGGQQGSQAGSQAGQQGQAGQSGQGGHQGGQSGQSGAGQGQSAQAGAGRQGQAGSGSASNGPSGTGTQSGGGKGRGQSGAGGQSGASGQAGANGQGAGKQPGSGQVAGGQGSGDQEGSGGQSGSGQPSENQGGASSGEQGGQSGSGGMAGSGPGGGVNNGPIAANHGNTGRYVPGGIKTGGPTFAQPQPINVRQNANPHYNEVTLPNAYDPHGAQYSTGKSQSSAKTPQSAVPYYRAYPQARQTAESAMGKQNIPAGYKRAVDKYFTDIAPQR